MNQATLAGCNPGEGCFHCPYQDCIKKVKSTTRWETEARKCDPFWNVRKQIKEDSGKCYFPKSKRGHNAAPAQSNHNIDLKQDTSYDLLDWIHYKF